jgi:hypothetical protein
VTETDTFRGLLTPDATPATIKPWADQTRQRADWHLIESQRLNADADALYRWIAQHGGTP